MPLYIRDEDADLDIVVEVSMRQALEEIGGDSIRDSIIFHLREKYSVKFEGISTNPITLKNALLKIFGAGARLIEKKIVENMAFRLDIDSRNKDLEQMIREAKEVFQV